MNPTTLEPITRRAHVREACVTARRRVRRDREGRIVAIEPAHMAMARVFMRLGYGYPRSYAAGLALAEVQS